ncbi:MAG TPA: hypothetical protein VF331_27870 [Polyangiales bacterium]
MCLRPTRTLAPWLLGLLIGCAASPPHAQHPAAARQIVVEEPSVVSVPARSAPPLAAVSALPPLGEALGSTAPAFQCAFALTEVLLQNTASHALSPVPRVPEVCITWLGKSDEPRPEGFGAFQAIASRALTEALQGPAHQRDVAVALSALWLDALLPTTLVLGPPPAAVASDPALSSAYQDAATRQNGIALHGALYTLQGCVGATSPADASFEPWRARCADKLAALQERVRSDATLRSALEAHQAALRVWAAGERPAGPALCWQPSTSPQDPAACGSGVAPVPAAPCQAPPSTEEEFAGPWPRDHRYGPRDPSTGVRVSVALAEPVALDARPLLALDTHAQLARCFAEAVPAAQPVTVAITAQLSVDARGQVTRAQLQPVRAGDAPVAPPSKDLLRCLRDALRKLSFGCGAAVQPGSVHATVCLRRD